MKAAPPPRGVECMHPSPDTARVVSTFPSSSAERSVGKLARTCLLASVKATDDARDLQMQPKI